MSDDEPVHPIRAVIAENLRRIRKMRGLTVRQLSHRLGQLGVEMLPTTVSECEQVRPDNSRTARKISVDDLLSLAVALNVSPIDLLTPIEGSVSIAPDVEPLPGFALEDWLRGDEPWPPNADRAAFIAPASDRRQRRDQAADRPEMRAVLLLAAMLREAIIGDSHAQASDPAAFAQGLRREARRVSKYVDLLADAIGDHDGR
jgi:transcriptional regulator with XRE-family HTH domain